MQEMILPAAPKRARRIAIPSAFKKLSILIPVYNEEESISYLLEKIDEVVLDKQIEKEIIVINDGSTDDTHKEVWQYIYAHPESIIKYIQHKVNMGKGSAVHSGLQEATGEYVLIQDADLEYDPIEYNNLMAPVLKGFADVVYGSRFLGGNSHRITFFWHSRGNRMLTFLSNAFTNLNLTDMCTGYKLFRRDILAAIPLKEKRFAFCTEVTTKMSRIKDIRIFEVAISYYGRTYKEGKKIKWRDGIRFVLAIIKYGLFDKTRVTVPATTIVFPETLTA